MSKQVSVPMAMFLIGVALLFCWGSFYSVLWLYGGWVYGFGVITYSWCIE